MSLESYIKSFDHILADAGLTPVARAGIWGQGLQESANNPAAEETPGRTTGGIGFWQHTGVTDTNPRRRNLEAFAASRGKPWQDMETQVLFVKQELLGPENHALVQLNKTTTPEAAAGTAMAYFERPADWEKELQHPGTTTANLPRREEGARQAFSVIMAEGVAAIVAAKPGETKVADAPTATTTQPVDQLAAFIKSAELSIEQVIRATLVAKGFPGPIIDMAFSLINQIDIVSMVEHIDIQSLIKGIINQMQKKA